MSDHNKQPNTSANVESDLNVAASLLDHRRYPGNAWADAKLRKRRRGGSMAGYFVAAGTVAAAAIVIALAVNFNQTPTLVPTATPTPTVAAAASTPNQTETSLAMIGPAGSLDLSASDLSIPQTDALMISDSSPTIKTTAISLPSSAETNAFEFTIPPITLPSNERNFGNES